MATLPAIPTNSELANEVRPHLSEFANELAYIQARPYSYARRQAAEDLMERTGKFVKWWHTRTEPLRKIWTEACKLDSDVAKSVEKINDAARRIIGEYDHAGLSYGHEGPASPDDHSRCTQKHTKDALP